jgi:pyruvate/2-oxoglutarate dehydrogenase complex dihydrolipoamide dehydrogenase (E3) component
VTRVVIIGGGPGGYEAALVAAQLGATVTVVERSGLGGACVLTDCVPSKTLIAAAEQVSGVERTGAEEWTTCRYGAPDFAVLNQRIRDLARAQSRDIAERLAGEGVDVITGTGRLVAEVGRGHRVAVRHGTGESVLEADVVLLATGARPRQLPAAVVDGERILTWHQLYDLQAVPEHLIVVGSGVTGAEFAGAYLALGASVTLVSSRDRVLPNEDPDAAAVVEDVFRRRGMVVANRSRAASVHRTNDGVLVTLTDGRRIEGSHCLLAVGSVPNTEDLGLSEVGVATTSAGFVQVDRVSRTTVPGIYAAGDCTGVLMLASVAAMQGRIAMWHALGESVRPLRTSTVAATVFTAPEIASVGVTAQAVASGAVDGRAVTVPLARNPRAKMSGIVDGFVKLFARKVTGVVLGGVVVAPKASELILPVSMAVSVGLTVDELAQTFSVYPSLSGSITEAGRALMNAIWDD